MSTNDIRELTMDEADSVSGGNVFMPIEAVNAAMSFFGKVAGKGAVLELVEKLAEEKKGKKAQ